MPTRNQRYKYKTFISRKEEKQKTHTYDLIIVKNNNTKTQS